MKDCAGVFANDRANLLDGKKHSGFVIRQHDRDNPCIATQSFPEIIKIKLAILIDFQPRNYTADFGEMLAQITHRFMFDTSGDDVAPGRVLLQKTTDRPVVGLGAARGEDNLAGVLCAQQVRDLCARVFDRVAHSATELIGGRWIAVERCQVRLHRLEYFRGYAGGRVVVQVNHFRVQASKYIATPRFTKRSQRFGTVVNLKSSAEITQRKP